VGVDSILPGSEELLPVGRSEYGCTYKVTEDKSLVWRLGRGELVVHWVGWVEGWVREGEARLHNRVMRVRREA